ncbi:phosphoglycerate mutase-like protein [Coprinopsis marcescibilis]|uniref:Phosphoglycerate mutase-like protein n=1 Tax=Coprinopsis marcescibilis TaxID=230819 RepID=A0A5C3L5L9_COPMA|nr:phosphoglycerate mutase-like protein [Coprinopsis marcescibilis]
MKEVWAGWKDSPLTNHGMIQAQALALSFATTPFTAIYTSDLKRAHTTAKALQAAQAQVPLHITDLLREQSFGVAEGSSYKAKRDKDLTLKQHFSRGLFPVLYGNHDRFPGGESKEDLRVRARQFFGDMILPFVRGEREKENIHIAVVSHGLFIQEIAVLLWKLGGSPICQESELRQNIRGMRNTAWTRIEISTAKVSEVGANATNGGVPPTPYTMKLVQVNCHTHIHSLIRQKGGISRLPYDPAQKDIRSFFSKNK